MKAPKDLMRKHHSEFLKTIEEFKSVFGNIKREHIKCSVGEWGKPLTGVEINPSISEKILNKTELSRRYKK